MLAEIEGSNLGVVLAGGASRRLGRDKALVSLVPGGETLLASAVRRLGQVCAEVVVADRGRQLLAGATSIPDGPGAGPAAAILGAAAVRPGSSLLVLACDLPRVPVALLRDLTEQPAADWVVPQSKAGLEPLVALYRPLALAVLAARVARGQRALHELAGEEGLKISILDHRQLDIYGPPEDVFLNVNRREDLARLGRLVADDSALDGLSEERRKS